MGGGRDAPRGERARRALDGRLDRTRTKEVAKRAERRRKRAGERDAIVELRRERARVGSETLEALASIAHQLSGLAAAAVRKRVARYRVTVDTDAEVVRLEGQHRAAHLSAASAHRAAVQALEDWGARAIVAAARELDSIG